jgi:hypothetical protein
VFINPAQQMVDNATSALRAERSTMRPRDSRGNGRSEAITRRLATIQKNRR